MSGSGLGSRIIPEADLRTLMLFAMATVQTLKQHVPLADAGGAVCRCCWDMWPCSTVREIEKIIGVDDGE